MWGTARSARLFVTSREDGETQCSTPSGLRVLRRWPVGDFAGAVSADGSAVRAGARQTASVRLLDLRSGRVRRFDGGHDASVLRMRFTADARTLVTTGADGSVIVWDVARGEIRQTLSGHAEAWCGASTSPPTGVPRTAPARTERAFVWDLTGDRSLVRPFASTARSCPTTATSAAGLALSPDGRTLAVGHSDGKVDLVDARTLRRATASARCAGFVGALAFSPDGRLLAATGQHGRVTLWDARTLRPAGELRGQQTTSRRSPSRPTARCWPRPNSAPVATGGEYKGGSVRVWDVRRRAATRMRFPLASPRGRLQPRRPRLRDR